VALWSDHDDIEELEFEFAMEGIRNDAAAGIRELPDTLLFCVFGSGWFNPRRGQRIYTESFKQLCQPFLNIDVICEARIRKWEAPSTQDNAVQFMFRDQFS